MKWALLDKVPSHAQLYMHPYMNKNHSHAKVGHYLHFKVSLLAYILHYFH